MGLRILAALFVSLSIVGAAPARAAEPGTDLGAFVLTPADIHEAGWTHDGAFTDQRAELPNVVGAIAAYRGEDAASADAAAVLTHLEADGWNRGYVSTLSRPSQANPTVPAARIRTTVTEYTSAAGAADGFTIVEDEHLVPTAKDLPADRTYGEQSELTADSGTSGSEGVPYRSLDLSFRVANLVADVAVIAYERGGKLAVPDAATVQRLAAIVESRLTTPAKHGVSLGDAVVLVTSAGKPVTYEDAYYRLRGADVQLTGERASDAAARVKTYADATEVYQLWQGLFIGEPTSVLYGVTVLRFASAAAATDWMDGLQSTLSANAFYGHLRRVDGAPKMGDQAVAFGYAAGGGADTPRAMLVAVRVGSLVARVTVVPDKRVRDVTLDPVAAFAKAEAACLAGDDCAEPTAAVQSLAKP